MQRQVDAPGLAVAGDCRQSQPHCQQVDVSAEPAAQRPGQPGGGRYRRAVGLQAQAQRRLQVQQAARLVQHRMAGQFAGTALQGLLQALAPSGFTGRGKVIGRAAAVGIDRPACASFSPGQRLVSALQRVAQVVTVLPAHSAHGHGCTGPALQRGGQCAAQRGGGVRSARPGPAGMAQRQVGTVQAAGCLVVSVGVGAAVRGCRRGWVGGRAGCRAGFGARQHSGQRAQHCVHRRAPQVAVQRRKVAQAHQHQQAAGRPVFPVQHRRHLAQPVGAL